EMRDELHRAALRLNVGLAGRNAVSQKNQIKFGALRSLGDFDVVLDVDVGVDLRAGVPPRRDVMAGRIEIGGEPHLAIGIHRTLLSAEFTALWARPTDTSRGSVRRSRTARPV